MMIICQVCFNFIQMIVCEVGGIYTGDNMKALLYANDEIIDKL